MKVVEYYICLALALVAVVLAALVFFTSRSAQALQDKLAAQQAAVSEEVNKGSLSQQVGAKLLQDTAQVALTNARVREMLARNGITLTPAPDAPAAPAPARKN